MDVNWFVLIPEETGQEFGDYVGSGWQLTGPFGGALGIIFSSYLGGIGGYDFTWLGIPIHIPEVVTLGDPVGMRDGHFTYQQTDLTVGSAEFPYKLPFADLARPNQRHPYKLSFESHYNSGARYQNGPLGLGWRHNWQMTAKENSNPFLGLGLYSPIDAAASIAEMFVTLDLLADTDYPVLNMVTVALANSWWCDEMTKNVVIVDSAYRTETFTRLPDGSYHAPYGRGNGWVLEKNTTFSITAPHQDVRSFDANGNLSTWTYPFGVTVTLTYDTGKLATVDNGMGRVINFNYDGDKLQSVDDDNARTVEFTFDGDELTEITDAKGEDVTFEYDEPGRLVRYFLPENPESPMVVNTYDSLDRVASQLDMNENEESFYLAGWRAEFVNALGRSKIFTFDNLGNRIQAIDELGFETNFVWDGLGRLVQKVFPEGNFVTQTYDENNNVLTETQTPKPGSPLAPIVRTYTWDATYNKTVTAEDGRGNVTTYSYHPATGSLLYIEQPEVDGLVPAITLKYNDRGQLISKIDQTGIQTQLAYDALTEELESIRVNTNWLAAITGSVTVSDQLTITVHDTGLGGGQKSKTYTVVADDTLSDIAAGLAAAINGDSEIAGLGITVRVLGEILSLSTAPGNATTFTSSTSGGATVTITLTAGLDLTTEYGYNAWGDLQTNQDPRGNVTSNTFDEKRYPSGGSHLFAPPHMVHD